MGGFILYVVTIRGAEHAFGPFATQEELDEWFYENNPEPNSQQKWIRASVMPLSREVGK